MGACCGRICPVDKLRRYPRRNPYHDATSLVEFENLIDETPDVEPRSISSWLSFGRNKLQKQEEALELEEEAAIEARREASRMALLAQSPSAEIINPAKLAFSSENAHQSWLGSDAHNWNVAGMSDIDSPKDELQVSQPLLSGSVYSSFVTNSTISSLNKADHLHTVSSTPPSSLDLEWENEAGLTPPLQFPSIADDDDVASMTVTDTTSNRSFRSTPASNENELEWDGDFTSTQIIHLDVETEQLINEIERMTADVLNDTNSNR